MIEGDDRDADGAYERRLAIDEHERPRINVARAWARMQELMQAERGLASAQEAA